MKIGLAGQVKCEGCEILTSITAIVTIRCKKCGGIFQAPIQSSGGMTRVTPKKAS